MAVQAQGRDATYDVARGIGMVLVIYGHLLEAIFPARPDLGKPFIESAFVQWQIIYSFHMMLFFLISGSVNRNLLNKSWPDVLRGSLRLLALAWVVHIIGAVLLIALNYAPDARRSFYDAASTIFGPIFEGYYWSIGVLWFLTSLCFVQILAYAILRYFASIGVALAAMIISIGAMYLPNYFLFKTWFPGLSFFVLGYLMAKWQTRPPVWLSILLFAAVIYLAPLNSGCHFTLAQSCGNIGPDRFGVWMFAGMYGYIPLFYLTALLGSIAVVSLSRGLARFKASRVLDYMGRNSLQLFILNGFVAVFITPILAMLPWPHLNVLHYAALIVGIVGVHLLALMLFRPALDLIDTTASTIAAFLTRLLSGGLQTRSA